MMALGSRICDHLGLCLLAILQKHVDKLSIKFIYECGNLHLCKENTHTYYFYAPAMTMARSIKCYPCPSVPLSVHMSHQLRQLPKSNSFDQSFMKLGHIVKYHNVFFKFDNGLYRTIPLGVIAPCS